MNVTDMEGATALSKASIQCNESQVLTGFKFEENEDATEYRFLLAKK